MPETTISVVWIHHKISKTSFYNKPTGPWEFTVPVRHGKIAASSLTTMPKSHRTLWQPWHQLSSSSWWSRHDNYRMNCGLHTIKNWYRETTNHLKDMILSSWHSRICCCLNCYVAVRIFLNSPRTRRKNVSSFDQQCLARNYCTFLSHNWSGMENTVLENWNSIA